MPTPAARRDTPLGRTPRTPHKSITPLSQPVRTALRSSVIIPTIPHLLSELLHNSLDAQAGRIDIWVDGSKEGQSLRVEDDGIGISRDGFRVLGERWRSSKGGKWSGGAVQGGYGFRGEALASIAALGLLEVITRPQGSNETYTKVIRGSKVLFEGVSSRSLGRERGTTTVVKDLFSDIPVRQASLASSSSNLLAACKKVVETLALVRPNVKWRLWEESAIGSSAAGSGLKKILSAQGGENSVDAFRSIYGIAGVERVQSIRVASGNKRIDGFISLYGSITRSHQHLYVNGHPLDRCDLHSVISKRFSQNRFSAMTDEGSYEFTPSRSTRKSPRRLERHPIYVLNIQLPPTELDASYTPGKTVMGYQDEEAVKRFVLAVVDEFLKRHEYVNPAKTIIQSPSTSAPISSRELPPMDVERSMTTPMKGDMPPPRTPSVHRPTTASSQNCQSRLGFASSVGSGSRSTYQTKAFTGSASGGSSISGRAPSLPMTAPSAQLPSYKSTTSTSLAQSAFSQSLGNKRKLETRDGEFEVDSSGRKRYKWIDAILAEVDSGVLNFTPTKMADEETISCCLHNHPISSKNRIASLKPFHIPPLPAPTTNIEFSGSSLTYATILGQIDSKFICAIIPPSSGISAPNEQKGSGTLVLIDQHAADERVSIEAILQELCDGFINDSMVTTALPEPVPAIILTRTEAEILSSQGVNDLFTRWGIELDISRIKSGESQMEVEDGGYVQIPILAVPTTLKARLGRKEGSEMTRLIKLYLNILGDNGAVEQIQTLIRRSESGEEVDWGEVLRWMPREMLELANSKACRNAIMFGDRLNLDQCQRLVLQLRKMRFPFMCAHGRPSMVPVVKLEEVEERGRRKIDWAGWKMRSGR